MKNLLNGLTFFLLLMSSVTFGQTTNKCDIIYHIADKMPEYDNRNSWITYLNKELIPIIGKCTKPDGSSITSLRILLTINKNAIVIDASFPQSKLQDSCKSILKKKLLTMTGWTAGQLKGKNVCTYYNLSINCLNWD